MLVTRPPPGAEATAARLAAMGLVPVLAPCLEIVRLSPRLPAPDAVQALLLTSAAALPALPEAWHRTPVLAVGDATAAQAHAAGFGNVVSAGRDAAALAAVAATHCRVGGNPLLLVGQRGQGGKLLRALRQAGFAVLHRSAYAARPPQTLPVAALDALRDGTLRAALFFSPASARAFVSLLPHDAPVDGVEACAISARTAASLSPLPWRRIRVASHPAQDALLALLQ